MVDEAFMNIIRAEFEKSKRQDVSDGEKLIRRILQRTNNMEECLKLQEDVRIFLKSDAPEEDKKMLEGYTECLYMLCSAIEDIKK